MPSDVYMTAVVPTSFAPVSRSKSRRAGCAVRLPVKALLLGTTFVSTGVSVLSIVLLFKQSVDSLHKTVEETSAFEVDNSKRQIASAFSYTEQGLEVVAGALGEKAKYGWNPTPKELSEYFHWSGFHWLRGSVHLYTFGVKIWPADPESPEALYQEMWYDTLRNGSKEWISGTYLPHQFNDAGCSFRKHCVQAWSVDPDTGERIRIAYNYTKTFRARELGKVWHQPSIWFSSDGNPYAYMGMSLTVPPLGPLYPDTGTTLVLYINLGAWQDILRSNVAMDSDSTFIACTLHDGGNSRVLATSTSEKLMEFDCDSKGREEAMNFSQDLEGRPHPCAVLVRDLDHVLQDAARILNATPADAFLTKSAAGSQHFMRRSNLVSFPNNTIDIPSIWLLWVRPVSSVDSEIWAMLTSLLIVCSGIFVFDCLVAVAEVIFVARPLRKLKKATSMVEKLDLRGADEGLKSIHKTIKEMALLVESVQAMIGTLREYRTYIPQAVLQEVDQDLRADSTFSENEYSVRGDNVETTLSGDSSLVRSHTGDSSAQARRRAILKETGTLHRRRATILVANADLAPMNDTSPRSPVTAQLVAEQMDDFIVPVLIACEKCAGVCLSVAADTVMAAWNTHRPRPDHAICASRCATALSECFSGLVTEGCPLDIREATGILSDDEAYPLRSTRLGTAWGAGLAGGQTLVGHVGTEKQRACVAIGAPAMLATSLARLAQHLRCPVLLSEAVNDAVASAVSTRVVDVVSASARRPAPVLIYELLGSSGDFNSPGEAVCSGGASFHYAAGFSALRGLKLATAVEELTKHLTQSPEDFQAVRLLRIAITLQATRSEPRGAEYVRKFKGWELPEEARTDCPTALRGTFTERIWDESIDDASISATGLDSTFGRNIPLFPSPLTETLIRRMDRDSERRSFATEPRSPVNRQSLTPQQSPFGTFGSATSMKSNQKGAPREVYTGDEVAGVRKWRRSERKLGAGTFGEVWLAMGGDGDLAAMKLLKLNCKNCFTDEQETELRLLRQLTHHNIVTHLGSAFDERFLVIVMEYLSGGSLDGLLVQFGGALPVGAVQRYLKDILRGLDYLHTQSTPIVHRDLKPGNVLLTIDGECKLADFGSAGEMARQVGQQQGCVGTALYMAPEAATGLAGPPSDIWSIGVLTIQLLTGRVPYSFPNGFHQFRFMLRLGTLRDRDDDPEGVGPVIPVESMTPDSADFCRCCLDLKTALRPPALELLTHRFLISSQPECKVQLPETSSCSGQNGLDDGVRAAWMSIGGTGRRESDAADKDQFAAEGAGVFEVVDSSVESGPTQLKVADIAVQRSPLETPKPTAQSTNAEAVRAPPECFAEVESNED
eukprot:TRINITY_DN9324_c0_g4_i1.p1 TRINITY_DN9324_c0_g4~~TRINITY_DN9324_c0_g4_i1.p1  ORF type:complete len:1348 (+),score=231.59 TRINITY_DN9324_c0_g4_i1:84-4127(+)